MTDLELKQLKARLKGLSLEDLVCMYAHEARRDPDGDSAQMLSDEIDAMGYKVKWEG